MFSTKTSRDQPGRSRAPILHFLAPLFDQSGSSRAPICASGPVWKQLKSPKNMTKPCTNAVFNDLAASRQWCPTRSRLDPDCRLDPDWIHGSARTHSRTYFPPPRPTLALFRAPAVHQYPPILHQNGQSNLKPNGGSTKYNNILFLFKRSQTVLKLPQLQLPVVPHKAVAEVSNIGHL